MLNKILISFVISLLFFYANAGEIELNPEHPEKYTVVKGDTLRGMWFYQTELASSSKMFLWFGSLRTAVARAIAIDGCKWVDLGGPWAAHELVVELCPPASRGRLGNWLANGQRSYGTAVSYG